MNVKQILSLKGSTAVETVRPETKVSEAARLLGAKRYGALMVTSTDGAVLGILSERDIVRGLGELGAGVLAQPVSAIMTEKVEHCALQEDVNSVMSRMTAGRFRHMPVVEGGELAGVVSIGDVVKARIMEIESEKQAMETMLAGQY
jgi:CBS domain-containing protein